MTCSACGAGNTTARLPIGWKRLDEDVYRGKCYSRLKKQLAERFSRDIDGYVEGKTGFVLSILAQYGFAADSLESIKRVNWTPVRWTTRCRAWKGGAWEPT